MAASVIIKTTIMISHSRDFPTGNPIVSPPPPPTNRLPPIVESLEEMAMEEDI